MIDPALLPEGIEIIPEDWAKTPPSVLKLIVYLLEENVKLKARIEQLEARLNQDSSNSNRPPSSDSPFKKSKGNNKKKGADRRKLSHPGHRQEMLTPTEKRVLTPEACMCGNRHFSETEPYYTHQRLELPPIELEVTHFELHRGKCPACGKMQRASVPQQHRTGYGPRLSAMIAEMAGTQADSRSTIQTFCSSVLGFHISLSAIQKVIDRASAAIQPHYETIGQAARQAQVNHIDETSHRRQGALQWLWVMANAAVAFFMVHPNRSKAAFEALIQDWTGILVSDGYGVYQKWVGLHQTCLAHMIRKAKELSERKNPEIKRFGSWATKELQRLCHMANDPPTVGQWQAFYARFIRLITLNEQRNDEAGKFARRLRKEIENLWTFLVEQGVAPTNNHAERMLRFAVLWRKCSQGTASEKGNRWVERILSLRQTCRIRSKPTFPVLVEALQAYFKEQTPDLAWITQPQD